MRSSPDNDQQPALHRRDATHARSIPRRQWLRAGCLSALGTGLLAGLGAPGLVRAIERLDFDHEQELWTALLQRHVRLLRGGQAS
jgi:hypothetical protein